ncbi:hypothetical protein ACKZDW_01730 (plasmid) [Ralstonia syzygii subsp. celebesensis]
MAFIVKITRRTAISAHGQRWRGCGTLQRRERCVRYNANFLKGSSSGLFSPRHDRHDEAHASGRAGIRGSQPAGVEQDLCNRIHGLQSVSPQPSMHPVNPFLV